jgi:subtilisin-like proprotein convertase family protein
MNGTVVYVTVKLKNFSHTWANDVDVLLVGPGGQTLRLMENAGTGPTYNSTLTFSDNTPGFLPETGPLPTGIYKPTAYPPAATYPAPAPVGPHGTTLSVFNGTGPNGTWSLYVIDDGPADIGSFAGGWELSILTTNCVGSTPTPVPTPIATPTPTPSCVPSTFVFEGNTATSGTAGNIRTYTVSGVTANVSGFNRVDSNGAWSTSYLGVYAHGLGVTNFSEGTGANDQHVVDNIGGNRDYVLFEFSAPIVVDQAYLDYVIGDSDISVWIGTAPAGHNILSDGFLASLGPQEDNNTNLATPRWADINAGNTVGNVLVISASASDTAPNDGFKLRKLLFGCQGGPVATPTPGCPTITLSPSTTSLPEGRKGHAYSKTITASGGSSPYTFTKTSGSLPTGITLSSGGVLSGTPTVAATYSFTIQARDTYLCTGSKAYTLRIRN